MNKMSGSFSNDTGLTPFTWGKDEFGNWPGGIKDTGESPASNHHTATPKNKENQKTKNTTPTPANPPSIWEYVSDVFGLKL